MSSLRFLSTSSMGEPVVGDEDIGGVSPWREGGRGGTPARGAPPVCAGGPLPGGASFLGGAPLLGCPSQGCLERPPESLPALANRSQGLAEALVLLKVRDQTPGDTSQAAREAHRSRFSSVPQ